MSLVVWLPLTKDLRQQGLSDIIPINNGGVTYSSTGGKLGGCYIFDGVDDAITIGNLSTLVTDNFSFACWFYHDDTWSSKNYETIFGGPSGFELETKNGSTQSPVIRAYSWGGSTFTYELNKWNHLVMTRTSSETKFYLNGELKLTGTAGTIPSGNYFIGSWSSTTSQNFKGKVNDVRIYDHCISPMEVKELAKGLVLHYPLNRQGWGQENLLLNTDDLTKWNKESGISVEWNETELMYKVFTTTRESSRWGIYQDYAITVDTDTDYTFSLTGKTDGFTAYLSFGAGTSWPSNHIAFTTTKQRLSKTLTIPAGTTNIRVYLAMYPQTGGGHVYFEKPKLEKGSIATPWTPNSSDALATTMGLNGTTEYDCSGFCNNGTKTGTFSWTSDTPKYQVSTYFNGSSYILTDSGTFSWFNFDECTVAVWMKPTSTPSSWAGTFGIAHNNSSSNKSFVIGNYGGIFTVQSANGDWVNIQSINLPINEWHHCVATLDNTTVKMYIDGELVKTETIGWGSTTVAADTRTQVGIDLPGADEIYQGYYSDARIYATALSADDVKSLYQNCATIDPDGTIRGQIRS